MSTTFVFDPAHTIGIDKLRCVECENPLRLISPKKLGCKRSHHFAIKNNVPILLSKESLKHLHHSLTSVTGQSMTEEYQLSRKSKIIQLLKKITNPPNIGIRIFDSRSFFDQVTDHDNPEKFVVSVGGGPRRDRKTVINLNIGMYPNVEIVADAHNLPFKDNSIDGIIITAVLEHLERPVNVVEEIYRVLKKGGLVYAETPFLQHYHGYPFHFQNYTISGHQYLFRKFNILASGAVSGPCDTVATIIMNLPEDFITNKYIRKVVMYVVGILVLPLRCCDVFFKDNPNAFKLTTGTYLLGKKK